MSAPPPQQCGAEAVKRSTCDRDFRHLRSNGVAHGSGLFLYRHHLSPSQSSRHRAHRVQPARGAQRLSSTHGRRALHRARPRAHEHRRGLRATHRQRTIGQRRRVGILQRRRPTHPRPRWLQVHAARRPRRCRRRNRRNYRARPRRTTPHPRGATPHSLHAQGRYLGGARLGRRWRT